LFFTCLTSPKDVYLHPKKKNVIVVKGKDIRINTDSYRAFFSQFKQEYRPQELEEITANKDRIIEDVHRRRTGAFFTPQIWADEAHKMIAEQFGENWKEEYVVWDCAAGTANLTRGYKFKELYISTLEQDDIDTIKDCGYNPEATIFQYDFLNEVGIDSCPDGLKKAFEEGKKVLFFINPPYGTASNSGITGSHKAGISKNLMNNLMLQHKMGFSARQLYCQFMYKISILQKNYNNSFIGLFSPPIWMTSSTEHIFRNKFYNNFCFKDGMIFKAGHFADVKSQWGISFSIWENKNQLEKNIVFSISDIDSNDYSIKVIRKKEVYSPNGNSASKWIRKEVKNSDAPMVESPNLSGSVFVKQKNKKMLSNAMGCINSNSNNVYKNITDVFIVSSCSSLNANISIIPENFNKVTALFTARKTIKPTWINCKDEYMVPNTEHLDYPQWNNDAIIYSLFNNSSQQSSLRQIDYKDKKWDIINNFFFMSNEEMRELANDNNFNEMYQDAKSFNEDRFVYNLLRDTELSDDAKEVLETAKELVRKSMAFRRLWHDESPEYHLNTWDSGWAQLKPMFKKYFKEDYDKFVKLYKKFEDRMREGVYKFGFLKE